jgi:uncharacterized protein (DUF58 family)
LDSRRRAKPNLLKEQAEQLASALPPLLVAAENLASTVSLGVHGRRKAGMGESFWQFRRYAPEDSAGAIDWRQSAKSQHLFVREREWEAAEAVWFWRDAAATMQFKSDFADTTKADRATILALALGSLLVRAGERIALMGEGRGPATGRATMRRIAHAMTEVPPGKSALPPDAPIRRHSHLAWFSDFLSAPDDTEAAMRKLSDGGVTGHLVHIVDPAEEDFPFHGRTRFEAVAGADTELFGRAEAVQSAYRSRFRAHGETIRAMARRMGWSYLAHRTDKRPELALVALYADIGGERVNR